MAYVFVTTRNCRRLRTPVLLLGLLAVATLIFGVVPPVSAAPHAQLQQQVDEPEVSTTIAEQQVVDSQPDPDSDTTAVVNAPNESVTTVEEPASSTTLLADTSMPETTVATNAPVTTAGETSVDTSIDDQNQVEQTEDNAPTTVDPLASEAPGEEAPDASIAVPEPTGNGYSGQGSYKPAEVLWSNVTAAEEKLAEVDLKRIESIKQIRTLRLRLKELGVSKNQLGSEGEAALGELLEATDQLKGRAVHDYMAYSRTGRSDDAIFSAGPGQDGGVDIAAIMAGQRELKLSELVLSVGNEQLDELGAMKESLDVESLDVFERLRVTTQSLAAAEQAMGEHDAAAEQAKIEYEAFRIGSEIFIDGAAFPIARPYSLPLIDSYGFPRMPGTADEHWHEGIDIFAPKGTPLVATERGVITKLGTGRLGGRKFWLVGESGSEWYYAHLDSFAPGLANGVLVEAGELVGYVGNTGNALTTPPHLHMQLHPGGGRPVNPYPLLKVLSDVDILGIENGTYTDSPYQPYILPGSDDPIGEDEPEDGASTTDSAPVPEPSTSVEPEPSTTEGLAESVTTPTTAGESTTEPTDTQVASSDSLETSTSQPTATVAADPAPSSTEIPTCVNADTDKDGDGWGFENDVSCLVP